MYRVHYCTACLLREYAGLLDSADALQALGSMMGHHSRRSKGTACVMSIHAKRRPRADLSDGVGVSTRPYSTVSYLNNAVIETKANYVEK